MQLKTVTVNSKEYTAGMSGRYEFKLIHLAGWVKITAATSRMLEFTFADDDGNEHQGYCECLAGNQRFWAVV
jgi:hypothetical protein